MTDLATSYSIMGTVPGFLSDVQQAKDNRIRELDFRLKNLGPEHFDVAGSYNDLGVVCAALGEFQQGKDYHSRALNILLKNLGPEMLKWHVLTMAWGSYVLPLVNCSKQRTIMVVR